jgi:hypothetical protein
MYPDPGGFNREQLRGETVLAPTSFIFLGRMEKWEKIFSFIRVDAGYDGRLSLTILVSC